MSARWGDGFWGQIGSTNIHNPTAINQPGLSDSAYPAARWREHGVFVNDVLALSPEWDLHLGGRHARIDRRFFNADGSTYGAYQKSRFTPSVAAVFKPIRSLSVYATYAEGLEQGGTAPLGTTNANAVMAPLVSKQFEAGLKGEVGQMSWEASLFRIAKAAEYTRSNADSSSTFVQDGRQVHQGLELSSSGKLSRELTMFGSAMWLDAKLADTADPTVSGKRPAGVAAHRLAMTTEYAPHGLAGWTFVANWSRTGKRAVTAANSVFAPDYDVFGLGIRHEGRLGGYEVTVRVSIDNLFDKSYWGTVYDDYLVPGAPRTAWASMSLSF